ncbi:MAG: hypothetical protein WCX71_01830 [Candidatus Buchananbacteria bacterium]
MINLFKSISRTEWRFLLILSLGVMALISLPYLYGYFSSPSGYVYDGIGSLSPADNPIYYSYINQIKSGQYLIKDLFTSENQTWGMFNAFWFLAGTFAKVFNLPAPLAFHLLRVILTPFFVLVAYLFIALFFSEIKYRKLATLLLLFSAGLGAYFVGPINILIDVASKRGYWTPNDIWIPESIAFLSLYKTPHFIASWIFMILILLLMYWAWAKDKISYVVGAGLLALVYFNFHPFYIPMIFGTLSLYLFALWLKANRILWQKSFYLILFGLICAPSIFYHSWLLRAEPILASRAWQNVTLAPPLIFIIIGYGFLWLLGFWGIKKLWQEKKFDDKFILLGCWLAVSLFLVVLPWQFQSRNTQGLHLPLAIFSVLGLVWFKDWLQYHGYDKKFSFWLGSKFLLVLTFIVALSMSLVFNVARDLYYFRVQPPEVAEYFYLKKDNLAAIKFLNQINDSRAVIAHPANGLFIPVFSHHPVYFAHGIETIDFSSKWLWLVWFFEDNNHWARKYQFLKQNNIGYIFCSDSERNIGDFSPTNGQFFKEIYSQSGVKIFQVQ